MICRPANIADLAEIEQMYKAQGFEYEFPDLNHPLFVVKAVAENGTGKPEMASALRLTAETFFFVDREHPPEHAAKMFLGLHEFTRLMAANAGLQDVNAWLPPQLEEKFGKQLLRLGWQKQLWPSYSRST